MFLFVIDLCIKNCADKLNAFMTIVITYEKRSMSVLLMEKFTAQYVENLN